MLSKAKHLVGRSLSAIAFLESALSAGANFALALAIVRAYPETTFAGYGTAISVVFILQAFARASLATPAAVKSDAWFVRRAGALLAIHLGLIAMLLALATSAAVAVALFVGAPLWWACAAATPALGLLFFGAEFERVALVKLGRQLTLLVTAVAAFAAMVALCGLALWGAIGFGAMMIGVGCVGAARIAVMAATIGRFDAAAGLRAARLGGPRFVHAGVTTLIGSVACSHAPVLILSILSTAQATAAFVAMRTLYQPMQLVFRSVALVDRTGFHGMLASQSGTIARLFRRFALRTLALSALFAAVLALIGRDLVHHAFGGRFDGSVNVYYMWGLIMIMINLMSVTDTFISNARAEGAYGIAHVSGGAVAVAGALVLIPVHGAMGAAIAALLGWITIVTIGALIIERMPGARGPDVSQA